MQNKTRHYRSYLLRIWFVENERPPSWRASLEDPHTGEHVTFTSLSRLFSFLEDQCSSKAEDTKRLS